MNVPRVSIGLPVYNGEQFLEDAIASLLQQTFSDLELVISDNASTDGTEEICRAAAAGDPRVRYHRNARNIGGSPNHNRVAELSRGEFFLWGAHDDSRAPEYLERCVATLDRDPDAVLCYTGTQVIDANGKPVSERAVELAVAAARPEDRFRDLVRMDHRLEPIYGLIRMRVLRATPLEGQYADCDRVLLAEIGLHGPFAFVPEVLFFRRVHAQQSTKMYPGRHQRTAWFDPDGAGRLVFPHFRQFREYLAAIRRAPLSTRQRRACYGVMTRWVRDNRDRLGEDLRVAARHAGRRVYHRVRGRRAGQRS